ncbi:unnamed protein product [Owenia fusiformis]|uniref:Major facilitator superfamily (MFS) profile domain-containing protein n=1 Tax=Owenia fusiformis TaxID=6347 RepID=A0A8S4P560_OWEFU|nr:unnamed protein product [Owenia fusiformis]
MGTDVKEGISGMVQYAKSNRYALYVLFMCMMAYLVNQMNTFVVVATNTSMAQELQYGDRVCNATNATATAILIAESHPNVTANIYCQQNNNLCDRNTTVCQWKYLGTGILYQLLAGPLYIVLYAVSGIPLGMISELNNINRKLILAICVILWSVMTLLSGFSQAYWHVAVCRLALGIFGAGCVPFAASIIAGYFEQSKRGAALGFFNWGIYVGYSISFLMLIAERNLGWRAVYFIAGAPGLAVGIIILITVKDPEKEDDADSEAALSKIKNTAGKLKRACLVFLNPILLILCLGGAIRNGAGIVWAYNINNFFRFYHPGTRVEAWMSWIPLTFGSAGSFLGGVISDKFARTRGPVGRLIVLIGSLLISAPFQVGTLFLPMPWAFISHIPAYLIGEMWIGVCLAVVVDLVPEDLRASSVAVYIFIIQMIGGNMNLMVTPLRQVLDLRYALLIGFPGSYVLGALIFILTAFLLKKYRPHIQDDIDHAEIVVPPISEIPEKENLAYNKDSGNGYATVTDIDTGIMPIERDNQASPTKKRYIDPSTL